MTVLDLSWIERTGDFTPYERAWHAAMHFEGLLARADRVICVSSATQNAMVARFGNEEKAVVVRSGPGLIAPANWLASFGSAPYFLVVGALEPRKAPELAVRAHALARARGLEAELVFAGDGRVPVGGEGVRVVRGASDEELSALYAGALAVVHPALLEGFGYPPIEGLAHGVPAIVADLPVYDETIGEGALRVPPGDEDALAMSLLQIEQDQALRAQLVAAGRAAIAELSWERAAAETHAVLTEAAG
jgi:glycosyltransferase involved in cell wall biosynthesis